MILKIIECNVAKNVVCQQKQIISRQKVFKIYVPYIRCYLKGSFQIGLEINSVRSLKASK